MLRLLFDSARKSDCDESDRECMLWKVEYKFVDCHHKNHESGDIKTKKNLSQFFLLSLWKRTKTKKIFYVTFNLSNICIVYFNEVLSGDIITSPRNFKFHHFHREAVLD